MAVPSSLEAILSLDPLAGLTDCMRRQSRDGTLPVSLGSLQVTIRMQTDLHMWRVRTSCSTSFWKCQLKLACGKPLFEASACSRSNCQEPSDAPQSTLCL